MKAITELRKSSGKWEVGIYHPLDQNYAGRTSWRWFELRTSRQEVAKKRAPAALAKLKAEMAERFRARAAELLALADEMTP